MKKSVFLLFCWLIIGMISAAENCIDKITLTRTGTQAINEVPDMQGETYVGSAPITLTFTVEFTDESNATSALLWTWRSMESPDVIYTIGSNTTEVIHTFDRFGRYEVKVEVTEDGGECKGEEKSIQITISESMLEVPNVISPNNDGVNDRWCVAFRSIIKYQCYIYNRWGRLVFSSSRPDECWDGTIGGKDADIGAYFYAIEAEGADGQRYKLGGDINLVR